MANTISTISTKGKAFVDESGKRFIVRGIALSPNANGVDLLSPNYSDYFSAIILPKLKDLNVNLIRLYQVDETADHSAAMNLLAENQIYVMVGLVTSGVSVNRIKPVYTEQLYNRITTVASEFCKYPNTFAFSVGNEVVFPGNIYNDPTVKDLPERAKAANNIIIQDAQVIKSMIKDLKAFMKDKRLRSVPVGMAMQDGPAITLQSWGGIGTDEVAQYYISGPAEQAADFIGINSYRSNNSTPPNAYDGHAQSVANFHVPVFLTEAGAMDLITAGGPPDPNCEPDPGTTPDPNCEPDPGTTPDPRTYHKRNWNIVPQFYESPLLKQNLSGQVAFQFFNKTENFGLYCEKPAAAPNPFTHNGDLRPTKYGGADTLSNLYGQYANHNVPLPTDVAPIGPPERCNPPLLPCPVAPGTISIKVKNYSDADGLVVVQNEKQKLDLPKGSTGNPVMSDSIQVAAVELYILQKGSWNMVCKVPADQLKDGITIATDKEWGANTICTIIQPGQ